MTNASGGGSTIQDPEGFKNPRETRRGIHWAFGSTVIAAVIRAVVGSLGRAYLGVAIGADRTMNGLTASSCGLSALPFTAIT